MISKSFVMRCLSSGGAIHYRRSRSSTPHQGRAGCGESHHRHEPDFSKIDVLDVEPHIESPARIVASLAVAEE
jgi:hypothetical protein